MDEQKCVCHFPKGLSYERRRGVPQRSLLSRCARGRGVIASNADFGPIPLPDRAFRYRHHGIGPAAVWCLLALAIAHSRSIRIFLGRGS